MTDRDDLLALLERWRITPEVEDNAEGRWVSLNAKHGNVIGYRGFLTEFRFDKDGNFQTVGVWE